MTSSRVKIPSLSDLVLLWCEENYPSRCWTVVDTILMDEHGLWYGSVGTVKFGWFDNMDGPSGDFHKIHAADPEFFAKLKIHIDAVIAGLIVSCLISKGN